MKGGKKKERFSRIKHANHNLTDANPVKEDIFLTVTSKFRERMMWALEIYKAKTSHVL